MTRLYHVRRPRGRMLLMLSMLVLTAAGSGRAYAQQLSSYYQFTSASGTFSSLVGATTVIFSNGGVGGTGTYNEDATAGPFGIGFNFLFNGTPYTTFTVNARGELILGSTLNSNPANTLESPPFADPVIAPFWDQQHMYDGNATCVPLVNTNVSYLITGVAPNRVLNVEWGTQLVSSATYYYAGNCLPMCNYQVRLYECSNRIEFQYGAFRISTNAAVHSTASIGIAVGNANFMSVTPGVVSTVSSVTANNNVDNNNTLATTLIPIGTIFRFAHFAPDVAGRIGPGNGGTPTMKPNDTLLTGMTSPVSRPTAFTPFSLSVPAGGCSGSMKYGLEITGPFASDYYFGTPGTRFTSGGISAGNSTVPPITFSPGAIGTRLAVLTVYDSTNGISRSFYLNAKGTSRVAFIGNVGQGGTVAMASGDTLMSSIFVSRGSSAGFTPMTLTNVGTDSSLPAAAVTYTIAGGGGQYSINPTGATLANGQSTTPTITFNAVGVGPQPATLTVNADGEVRTFTLNAVAAVPSAVFRIGSQALDSSTQLFANRYTCVGESYETYAVTAQNASNVPFIITGLEVYATDTTFTQGSPRYPLARGPMGRLVPMRDYFITMAAPVAPLPLNPLPAYPLVMPVVPSSTTMYLTFIGQRPGKRFARLFLRTNCLNFSGPDTNGVSTPGLLRMDLFGRGRGGAIADGGSVVPKGVTFPDTRLDDSATMSVALANAGVCDLRISLHDMMIVAGDVEEFRIVGGPYGLVDAVTNDLIIGPGMRDSVIVRFKPSTVGSRRATLRLRTNDSAIAAPANGERGTVYLDLYGRGKGELYGTGADLGQALIGGGAAEFAHGVLRFHNAFSMPLQIDSIRILGTDAGEFQPDAGTPAWPLPGDKIASGAELALRVAFAPVAGGTPGERNAFVRLYAEGGVQLDAALRGTAGTRTISVEPLNVSFGTVSVGTAVRRTVAVRATGTMPLKLTAPVPSPGLADFTLGATPRLELAPGQTEYLEITFKPGTAAAASGTYTFGSNATDGDQIVNLNGTGTRTRLKDDPSSSATSAGAGGVGIVGQGANYSVSGVAGARDASGLALFEGVPNPGNGVVAIGYMMPTRAEVTLEIFDAAGRRVLAPETGVRDAGEHRILVDVSGLPSGAYMCRLVSGGHVLARPLLVAH